MLALHSRLLVAVTGNVDVVLGQRSVGLGVPAQERVLVGVPEEFVLVPVRQVLVHLHRVGGQAVHDGDEDVPDLVENFEDVSKS